jgi:hypothetical protein
MKIKTKTKSSFTPQPEPPGLPFPDLKLPSIFKGLSY